MKKKNPFFGLFFGLIIISIPIFNQLHYTLIDHFESIDKSNKEVIHHQCNHFTFYVIFLDTHDEPKIEKKEETVFYQKVNVYNIEHVKTSTVDIPFGRGPPFDDYFII